MPVLGAGSSPEADATAPRIFESAYYERMRNLESDSWWNAGMRDVAARLLNLVSLPPTGTVLNVGCGSGQSRRWALELLGGWSAVGLDVAAEGIESARAAGLNVLQASALEIPWPTASVDLVITLDVLQHLPLDGGDDTALREIHRVLRPGGVLFVRTNALAYPRTRDDPRFDFRKYKPDQLRARLEHTGFEVRRLSRINALLGLVEIPRELRANRQQKHDGYHGLLATPSPDSRASRAIKRWWLNVEGRAIASGLSLPLGRSIVALAVAKP